MKHSEHGSGVLKHCGSGVESCRPAPKHLMAKQAKAVRQANYVVKRAKQK